MKLTNKWLEVEGDASEVESYVDWWTTKEYDEEQIWPISDDDDDWCNDEVDEDDE